MVENVEGGSHKKGEDIRQDTIQDQSIAILFTTMNCFSIRSDGQVSLIVNFFEKSSEYQRKWGRFDS